MRICLIGRLSRAAVDLSEAIEERTLEMDAITRRHQPKGTPINVDPSEDGRMAPSNLDRPCAGPTARLFGTAPGRILPSARKPMSLDLRFTLRKMYMMKSSASTVSTAAPASRDQQSSVVTDFFIEQAFTGWDTILLGYLKQIDDLVRGTISDITDHEMQRHCHTALHQTAHNMLEKIISELLTQECQSTRF